MKLATSALLLFVSAALAAPLDARTDPDSTLVQSVSVHHSEHKIT